MFNKRRKLKKYDFSYGKSPVTRKDLSKNRFPGKTLRRQNPTTAKIKKITILSVALFVLIATLYGLFFSSYFTITTIEIQEQDVENEGFKEEVKTSIENAIGKNLVFIDTEELKLKILETFPEIEQVEIKKDYPRTLVINFSEYELVANVINESSTVKKSYIINSIGYAIKENFENPNLPYIKIKTDEPANPENPIIEANKLRYILEAIIYFEDKFGMRVIEVEYKKIPREIHILTEKNFYIWLDIQKTIDEQFKKLKKALTKLDIYNENLEYIDLRIAGSNGDKIIYKRK
jgi:cell division septal protein FtsQ